MDDELEVLADNGRTVVGTLDVTDSLSKGGGSFTIDHPLDPENMHLYHSFVESPDMMNIHNGNVTTDEAGYAVVTLREWFEAPDRDFRPWANSNRIPVEQKKPAGESGRLLHPAVRGQPAHRGLHPHRGAGAGE